MDTVATFPVIFTVLAHDMRWRLLAALAVGERRAQELVERVSRPMNLVSYRLAQLHRLNLVQERRSSADARDVCSSLDLERLRSLNVSSGVALHPLLGESQNVVPSPAMLPVRLLFRCTHNSAQPSDDVMLRQLGGEAVEDYSAGAEVSAVHPLTIAAKADLGIDIGGRRSKHLDELRGESFDAIVTVCHRMCEECPVFQAIPHKSTGALPIPLP